MSYETCMFDIVHIYIFTYATKLFIRCSNSAAPFFGCTFGTWQSLRKKQLRDYFFTMEDGRNIKKAK